MSHAQLGNKGATVGGIIQGVKLHCFQLFRDAYKWCITCMHVIHQEDYSVNQQIFQIFSLYPLTLDVMMCYYMHACNNTRFIMFSNTKKKQLIRKLQRPLRLKDLRGCAAELMKDTRYRSVGNFVRALEDEGIIQKYTLEALNGRKIPICCSAPLSSIDVYDLAASVLPDGYFCNLTAIYHHSLTNQVPNSVYWCHKSLVPPMGRDTETLSDSRIRSAFIRTHRHTSFGLRHNAHDIWVIAGVRDFAYGVEKVQHQHSPCPAGSRVTCLERALIDAVVSPQYNGGLTSLCDYFHAAQRRLNMARMLDIYRKLDFVYPYAQSLGFFMEHCGMQSQAEELRKAYPPRQHFYVDHGAKTTWAYNQRWMVFHPKGLVNED